MDYNRVHANPNKEASMKLILATILAGSFLISLPVRADDNPPAGDKSDKPAKKDKKKDKKADKGDKGAAPAGGGW
jgi:hypothetical protein